MEIWGNFSFHFDGKSPDNGQIFLPKRAACVRIKRMFNTHVFDRFYILNQLAQMFFMWRPEDGQQMTETGSPKHQL